jgi:hypothetical protein
MPINKEVPQWNVLNPDSRAADIQSELKIMALEPMVENYKPELIGEGAEHLVFSIANHPKIVGKVANAEIAWVVRYNVEHGLAPEILTDEIRQLMEKKNDRQRQGISLLREYFPGMVPMQRVFITTIPATNGLLRMIAGPVPFIDSREPFAIPVRMNVQGRLPLEDIEQNGTDICFRYLERASISGEEYEESGGVLDGSIAGEVYLRRDFVGTKLLALMQEDEKAKMVMRDFVQRALEYTLSTGEILDLAGAHNAVLFKRNTDWKILLPDALYGMPGVWCLAKEAMEDFLQGEGLNAIEGNCLMNALNYAKLINALADVLGIQEKLKITKVDMKGRWNAVRQGIVWAGR